MHHLLVRKIAFSAGYPTLKSRRDQAFYKSQAACRNSMVQRVMERIINQTIPKTSSTTRTSTGTRTRTKESRCRRRHDESEGRAAPASITNKRQADTRYAKILVTFQASKLVDPYSPTAPTHIRRSFEEGRQMLESRVDAMLKDVVTSPLVPRVAKLIEKRLGRKLEPFDIWYNGFRARGAYTEAELDAITRKRYPTAEAYKKDMAASS
jgi:hypothetical protein